MVSYLLLLVVMTMMITMIMFSSKHHSSQLRTPPGSLFLRRSGFCSCGVMSSGSRHAMAAPGEHADVPAPLAGPPPAAGAIQPGRRQDVPDWWTLSGDWSDNKDWRIPSAQCTPATSCRCVIFCPIMGWLRAWEEHDHAEFLGF